MFLESRLNNEMIKWKLYVTVLVNVSLRLILGAEKIVGVLDVSFLSVEECQNF